MANNLRPPSVINDLRTQAHLALSARLQNLDLTPLLVMTLGSNIPASIIPYLIWQFDMMQLATALQALGISTGTILQNALPLHRALGTPYALKQALTLAGYPGVTLLEGQNSWGGSLYPASQGWAVFRIILPSGSVGAMFSQAATGAINGSNRNFGLPTTPTGNAALRVFYNGLLQAPGPGYSFSGLQLLLNFTPLTGETLAVALRGNGLSPTTSAAVAQIVNFARPARAYPDSVEAASFTSFFDAVVPTVSGSTLVLPETPTSLELYRNGLYQTEGVDYTISGAVVTPTVAPGSDAFIAWGTYGSSTSATPNFNDWVVPAATSNPAVFTLPSAPSPSASLRLYLGASGAPLLQTEGSGADYVLSGSTITFNAAPPSGSVLSAFYRD